MYLGTLRIYVYFFCLRFNILAADRASGITTTHSRIYSDIKEYLFHAVRDTAPCSEDITGSPYKRSAGNKAVFWIAVELS